MALSVGVCFGKSSLRQNVVAKFVRNFNSAILVLTVGVWAASIRILQIHRINIEIYMLIHVRIKFAIT